jgi:hypothetical protein
MSGLVLCVVAQAAEPVDQMLERDVEERYHVLVRLSDGELERHVWPKFPVAIELTGSDGRRYTMRQPFELYSETRRYLPTDSLDAAYERLYAQLVADGDCLPVYAAFRDAAFDCGERQGMRSVAVRSDAIAPHLASEMIATDLIPDEAEFARARAALDELTLQLTSSAVPAGESDAQ